MTRTGQLIRLIVLLALISSPGCFLPSVQTHPPTIRIGGATGWPVLPSSYRTINRIHVEVGGRVLDFLGYLAVSNDRWRAVGFSELGGRIFDLIHEDGRSEVLLSPPGLPRKALIDGVMRDIEAAFTPRGKSAFGEDEELPSAGRITTEGPATMTLISAAGKPVSEISVLSTRAVEGWLGPVPERWAVKNRRWGYTMEVTLIRMDMRPVDETAFRRSEVRR
jgi:hypothetical protein